LSVAEPVKEKAGTTLPVSESKSVEFMKPTSYSSGTTNRKTGGRSGASFFKYYLHDSAEAFRIQFLGELTQAELGHLNGCWNTAKTTLGSRKLVLDVTGLKSVDDHGREWLEAMIAAGAVRYSDSSKAAATKGNCTSEKKFRELGLLARLISLFRSSRTVPAGSTTQAQ
jgi:hypothetical protein